MRAIRELDGQLARTPEPPNLNPDFETAMPRPAKARERAVDVTVRRRLGHGHLPKGQGLPGLWLSPAAVQGMSRTLYGRIWWWLPPVLWPDEEAATVEILRRLVAGGARSFVCNSPWQRGLFAEPGRLNLIAGPFCNAANALALESLRELGYASALVSPELDRESLLRLPSESPLPLGLVIEGFWPLGVSRIKPDSVKPSEPLESPKLEEHFVLYYAQNAGLYPSWSLDLTKHRPELEAAGYTLFARLEERRPKSVPDPGRTSEFNWEAGLL